MILDTVANRNRLLVTNSDGRPVSAHVTSLF